MRLFAKIITVIFLVMMGFFTLFQYYVGNPFFDEIHPVITTAVYFLMAITAVFIVFRKK